MKQGRSSNHPEFRCNTKQRQAGHQQQKSSYELPEPLGHSCDNSMGFHNRLGCKEHDSLNFDQFKRIFGVKNENNSCNVNNVNMMPVVANNKIKLNSCGGGKCADFNVQAICHTTKPMNTVSSVNLTVNVDNALLVDAYKAINGNDTLSPQHDSPGSVIDHIETNPQILPGNHYFYACHTLVHKIDRFNYTFVNHSDNSHNQFVHIRNYPQNKPGVFYFLNFSYQTGQINILEGLSHPVDVLQVCDSIYFCIYPAGIKSHTLHTKHEAKLAYENYKQDCLSKQRYGMSYKTYMNNVISSLIDGQCEVDNIVASSPDTMPTLYKRESNGSKIATVYDTEANVASCDKCQTYHHRDINYPSKVKGYMAKQPTEFEFIGPDRPGIDTKDSEQYLKLARTIREPGVPNYRQVRVSIKSDLNIEAWRRHLSDYKDQVLLQYLKYSFPLSIKDPRFLTLISQIISQSNNTMRRFPHIWSKKLTLGRLWAPSIKLRITLYTVHLCSQEGPRWQSGNTLASHLCGQGSIPIMVVSGKAGSCLPLVGSLQ